MHYNVFLNTHFYWLTCARNSIELHNLYTHLKLCIRHALKIVKLFNQYSTGYKNNAAIKKFNTYDNKCLILNEPSVIKIPYQNLVYFTVKSLKRCQKEKFKNWPYKNIF